MPEFSRSIEGPDLRGLAPTPRVTDSGTRQATAEAAATLVSGVLGIAGRSMAQSRGRQLGGETETGQQAAVAVEEGAISLDNLLKGQENQVGGPISPEQIEDLRKNVFDKTLKNYKRIQSALDRGYISSTEANARMDVLRSEALSNPLVARYQDQLDDALFRTTGGSGKFGPTTDEQNAAAAREGQLSAIEETEKQATSLMRTGVAATRQQAMNILAQSEELRLESEFLAAKKSRLGLTSQEAYAASQNLATQQSASALNLISSWSSDGGPAEAVQGLRQQLVNEAEAIKQAIRAAAFDSDGNLIVEEGTLRSQLSEVDNRLASYNQMLQDQSGTQHLMSVIEQRSKALEFQGQNYQIQLAKYAPFLYALKDNQAASDWYWNYVTNSQNMVTTFQKSRNPLLKWIAEQTPSGITDVVARSSQQFMDGGTLDDTQAAVASKTLTSKGGTAAVDRAMEVAPEQTVRNLEGIPFNIRDVYQNREWLARAKSPEGAEQVQAIIKGAAQRALVSSWNNTTRRETAEEAEARGATRRRWDVPSLQVPKSVTVKPRVNPERPSPNAGAPSNIAGLASGLKTERWANATEFTIDTGGVPVSDEYKSELVNTYKMGMSAPNLWQEDFESIDAWINHLFARPGE